MDTAKIASAATVVLGIIIVAISWHAYFESQWNKAMRETNGFQHCEQLAKIVDKNCPSLALEQYFISISFITLLISAVCLIGILRQNDAIKRFAPAYNIGASLLLSIGGVFVIVSASQINGLHEAAIENLFDSFDSPIPLRISYNRNTPQYYDEKIAAGVLSFIAAFFYGAAGKGLKSS